MGHIGYVARIGTAETYYAPEESTSLRRHHANFERASKAALRATDAAERAALLRLSRREFFASWGIK